MSRLPLSIDCRRIPAEPAVLDPLERQTWAEFRLVVDGVCVTEFFIQSTDSCAKTLFLPAFPVADWIVRNWWALLFEPCRWEEPPRENSVWRTEQSEWLSRHCLRTSESSLFLPFLHLYSDGEMVSVEWRQDDRNAATSMPGHFERTGSLRLERFEVERALHEFVADVLDWCGDLNDARVRQMRKDYDAIKSADDDEVSFCQAAGRMGLDPYAVDDWPEGLADFLAETVGSRLDEPVVRDFCESTDLPSAQALWAWIDQTQHEYRLSPGNPITGAQWPRFRTPKDQGYHVARSLRETAGLDKHEPIADLAAFAGSLNRQSLHFMDFNHSPSRCVKAVVGWEDGNVMVVAGPRPARQDNARFLESRGLYQALTGCAQGPRLLTNAHTWDQQASRAFAAELLAPGLAVRSEVDPGLDFEERVEILRTVADKYNVSTNVIELQLLNQGFGRSEGV